MSSQIIKFIDSSKPQEVTPVDVGVLELKSAVENLEAAIDRLQDQIDELSMADVILVANTNIMWQSSREDFCSAETETQRSRT